MERRNKPKAAEPAVSYGENVPTMPMVRKIRNELSELYWKDPVGYIEESKRISKEFMERFPAQKGVRK